MAEETRTTESLPRRTLRTGGWLAAWMVLLLSLRGWWSVALGVAVGSALSLFSLWSLVVLVPALLRPGRRGLRHGLTAILFLKFPLYVAVLYWATQVMHADVFALFGGIALVPVVIVLKIVGQHIVGDRKVALGE